MPYTNTSVEAAAYKFRAEDLALATQLLWCHTTQNHNLRTHQLDKYKIQEVSIAVP
jgi:hypothetical protein